MEDDGFVRDIRADEGKDGEVGEEDEEMIDHNLLFDFDLGILFILRQKVLEANVEVIKCAEELVNRVENFSKGHCCR